MYLREVHVEKRIPVLQQIIRDYPLGILTTAIPSSTYPLIQSSHIPFLLDVKDEESGTDLGLLRGHMAKMNPQSKAMIDFVSGPDRPKDAATNVLDQEVLVLFTSPIQHYVTPRFYVETKPATGKVVPTWNYAAVQAYGRAKIYYDSKASETQAFLEKALEDLSHFAETAMAGHTGTDGSPAPWTVDQAPDPYLSLMKKNIIGIEIQIERLEGKFKMSQELKEGDRVGVVDGFGALGNEIGKGMASLVKERGEERH